MSPSSTAADSCGSSAPICLPRREVSCRSSLSSSGVQVCLDAVVRSGREIEAAVETG